MHTFWFFSHSRVSSVSLHLGHLTTRFPGALRGGSKPLLSGCPVEGVAASLAMQISLLVLREERSHKTLRIKRREILNFLAGSHKFNRHIQVIGDGKSEAALGRAIEFCDNH